VNEGTLGVHKVEFVVKTGPCFGDGGGVGQHTDGTLNLGKVTSWDNGWWLVVNTDLETSWAPVNELDGSLGLDGGNGSVDILWHNITSVQHTAGHVFSVTWVTLDHLVGWLETHVGDFGNRQLLVVGLLGRDDWSIGGQWEVDTWVWDQIGLEFSKIDVQGTIESERSSDRGYNLGDQSVQVGVGWTFNVQVSAADIVDGFVINHEGTVGVFQSGVASQDRVVWLDNSGGNLWGWVDSEFQFGFLAVVNGETFHQKGSETRSSSSTERVEDQESLETSALIGQFSDAVKDQVNEFLTDGVVTTGVVVGGIFLSGDQLLWVEQLSVGSSSDFVNNSWLKVDEDTTWDVFAGTSFREKGVERVVTSANGLV
jgi:hypothetical protein